MPAQLLERDHHTPSSSVPRGVDTRRGRCTGGDTGVAVALCVRMKNSYVKKGTPPLPPETPRMDFSPIAFILTVSSLRLKRLPSKRLQRWFNGDIMTNPRKPLSSDVLQSIVADKREASMLAYHGMVSRKWNSTNTVTGYIREYAWTCTFLIYTNRSWIMNSLSQHQYLPRFRDFQRNSSSVHHVLKLLLHVWIRYA